MRTRVTGMAVGATVALAPALLATPGAVPAEAAPRSAAVAAADRPDPPGRVAPYPRQIRLTEPPVDDQDAAIRRGLIPYHQLSRALNDLQGSSDRVSAEVIATTMTGREVYLVTLTAPESRAEARRQASYRDEILSRPARAATNPRIAQDYKTPVFVGANIHGNEWEGTDAAMRMIQDYATSTDPAVLETLERSRISFVLSINPDGRHDGTRSNASGFNINRDFITASQPETRAVRDALIRTQPLLMLDLHGYVNGTLIEPTTPPHGENYEYDLFIKHAYPNGLGIEQAVLDLGYGEADGVRPPQIPFRDWDEGWDDWPPIFTPQYAAFHGAVSHTIEVPLQVNNAASDLPETELRRRSAINTDVAYAAVTATLSYAEEHRDELLADQIEVFRRGEAGEAQREVTPELFPEIGPEDVYTTDYPRAFVIPVGDAQRSAPAAARLVEHLIANDVQVQRLQRPLRVDGRRYPAGSYVVDMHQAKRGMANTILGAGTDISDRVDSMYDISGWSHALLWGASVLSVPDDGSPWRVRATDIDRATPTDAVEGDGPWRLRLADPADVRALTTMLAGDVDLEVADDGSVLVPADAGREARRVAEDLGVRLAAIGAGAADGAPVDGLTVAAAATDEEVWALSEMGLTVRQVDADALNGGGFSFEDQGIDALYVSAGLRAGDLDEAATRDLQAFLADGGGLVGRGRVGAALNDALDLLDVQAERGRGDANGVVRVDSVDGPIAGDATPHTFIYSPLWFTDLGDEVSAQQRFPEDDLLVSGHWRPDAEGQGGPGDAAGEALVVSGTDESGADVVLFGSEPLFRDHPKGQFALVARALLWSSTHH